MNKKNMSDLPACWYQIMPDKFAYAGSGVVKRNAWSQEPTGYLRHGGTLQGIAEKVENGYFEWISKNCFSWGIYLTPVYENASSYHKYWPDDHWQVDKALGGVEGLRMLVAALRKVGGLLMVDLVFNHTGITHYFFVDILRYGAKSQYFSHYRVLPDLNKEKIRIPILENTRALDKQWHVVRGDTLVINDRFYFPYIGECIDVKEESIEGPHFQFVRSDQTPNYGGWWGLPELPELNTCNEEVKEYLFNSVCLYLELGIRHFRFDVPDALPNAEAFWLEFRRFLESRTVSNKEATNIYLVGEIWDWKAYPKWLKPRKCNPAIFDAVMNYPIRRAVINFLGSENVAEEYGRETGPGSWNATETRHYLEQVWEVMELETRIKQLNLLGSHDVTRLGDLVGKLQDRKTALALLFSYPGIPCIFYGDELGIKGRAGQDGAGARKTVRWVTKATAVSEDEGLIDFLALLLNIKKTCTEWNDGRFEWVGNHEQILAFERIGADTRSIIITAPSDTGDSVLLEWIQQEIDVGIYSIQGVSENIGLREVTEELVGLIRKQTGAIIARR